jgi:hypothetical protein
MGEIPWGTDAGPVIGWLEVHAHELDVLIVENYRNLPDEWKGKEHANTWSENHESQIIGMCRLFCVMYGIELVIQEPSIKPSGYGFAGLPPYKKGKKKMHRQDALAHGAYWWMMVGRKRDA